MVTVGFRFSGGIGFGVYSEDNFLTKVRINMLSDSQADMKSLDSVFL